MLQLKVAQVKCYAVFQFHIKFFSIVPPATLTAICHLDTTVMCQLAFKSEMLISEYANYPIVIQASDWSHKFIFGLLAKDPFNHLDSAGATTAKSFFFFLL